MNPTDARIRGLSMASTIYDLMRRKIREADKPTEAWKAWTKRLGIAEISTNNGRGWSDTHIN